MMGNAPASNLFGRARRWAIALTQQKSVTGTDGEASFGLWFANMLGAETVFRDAKIWTIEIEPGDGRHCVAMLVRGTGQGTIILTGHYDTVSTHDYGQLEDLATEPEELTPALAKSLHMAETSAAQLAKTDLASGEFLAGRGLLDMKAGLAAGLAVCAEFAERVGPVGNLLFIAVPDEENNSAGARRAVQVLPELSREHDLDIAAAINLDAISDDGDGSKGRVIALGTVGKLLPTVFVAGVPAHSGFPLNGVNAGALAAAIAARIEWAPELTDGSQALPGTPPSLLSIRDGKAGYDVTTPATAFATFNVLSYRRAPDEVLERFDRLCLDAARDYRAQLARRIGSRRSDFIVGSIPLYRYETVLGCLEREDISKLEALSASVAAGALSLPEQSRIVTEEAWKLSQLPGPAMITGFGSIPYLATTLSDAPTAARLRAIASDIRDGSSVRYGSTVSCTEYFAGISDMSFFGEAASSGFDVVGRNTPMWRDGVRWPKTNGLADIPTINIGPWGRDYHTPLERLHTGYAFDVLPRILRDVCEALLNPDIQ